MKKERRRANGVARRRTRLVHILILERHRDMRRVLALMAKLAGCRVFQAASMDEALMHLARGDMEVAVLEEEAGGLELCRRIKGDPAWQHIYIMMTALLPLPRDAETFLAAGAAVCLERPINMKAFRQELRRAIRPTRARRADHNGPAV